MKTTRIIYWISTILIFLFEGVMPALTGHTELAKEGIRHLGYPDYFGTALTVSKVLGATLITIPVIPKRIKEWAYVGLALEFIFAFISHTAVDGFSAMACFPLAVLAVLVVSYLSYHKLN
jgi:hypothetical protein